jgi:hypothetical protein
MHIKLLNIVEMMKLIFKFTLFINFKFLNSQISIINSIIIFKFTIILSTNIKIKKVMNRCIN